MGKARGKERPPSFNRKIDRSMDRKRTRERERRDLSKMLLLLLKRREGKACRGMVERDMKEGELGRTIDASFRHNGRQAGRELGIKKGCSKRRKVQDRDGERCIKRGRERKTMKRR